MQHTGVGGLQLVQPGEGGWREVRGGRQSLFRARDVAWQPGIAQKRVPAARTTKQGGANPRVRAGEAGRGRCERERQGEGGEGAVAPIPPEPGSRGDTWEPMGVPDEIAPSGAMPSTGRGVLAEQRLNASPLQPVDLLEVDDMVGRAGVDRQLRV